MGKLFAICAFSVIEYIRFVLLWVANLQWKLPCSSCVILYHILVVEMNTM